jgi:hypothetical protein
LLLREGREATSVLHNIDKEHEVYTYMSWWFNVYCNTLDNFEEMLTFDDVVAEDEATQAGVRCSRAIDELGSFTWMYRWVMLTYFGTSITRMLYYLSISYSFCMHICLFICIHLMKTFL